jgi:hypothetical protein
MIRRIPPILSCAGENCARHGEFAHQLLPSIAEQVLLKSGPEAAIVPATPMPCLRLSATG